MSQLGLCMSLHEDIQCRYSLACNRLTSLLSTVQVPLNSVEHTLYYLKQGKKVEDDKRILQAYYDCMSLQLQLNLAECAIDRLQGMLGIRPQPQTGRCSDGCFFAFTEEVPSAYHILERCSMVLAEI